MAGVSGHLEAVAVIAGTILLTSGWGRRQSPERAARAGKALAVTMILVWFAQSSVRVLGYGFPWRDALPFHLCDALAFLGPYALWTQRKAALDCVYFWTLGGTLHSLITPTPDAPPPDPRFFLYFANHGLLVLIAVYVAFGLRYRPDRIAIFRALAWMNVLIVVASAANALLGTNFGYLRAKPPSPTLVDVMGPWPTYIAVGELVALASFAFWALPFLVRHLLAGRGAHPPPPPRPSPAHAPGPASR